MDWKQRYSDCTFIYDNKNLAKNTTKIEMREIWAVLPAHKLSSSVSSINEQFVRKLVVEWTSNFLAWRSKFSFWLVTSTCESASLFIKTVENLAVFASQIISNVWFPSNFKFNTWTVSWSPFHKPTFDILMVTKCDIAIPGWVKWRRRYRRDSNSL